MTKKPYSVLVFSDTHGVFLDKKAFSILCDVMKDNRFDETILNGDICDFPYISKHTNKLFEEGDMLDYSEYGEIEFTKAEIIKPWALASPGSKKIVRLGNHCFTDDTEILTHKGFKLISAVNKAKDKVGTYNILTGELEYQEAAWTDFEYEGKIYTVVNDDFNFSVTPMHRMVYSEKGESKIRHIEDIPLTSKNLTFPLSCTNKSRGLDLSSEEIKEMAELKYLTNFASKLSQLSKSQFDSYLKDLTSKEGSFPSGEFVKEFDLYLTKRELSLLHPILIQNGYWTTFEQLNGSKTKISIKERKDTIIEDWADTVQIHEWSGRVFCVTVNNGTVITRRRGKVLISGNCERVTNPKNVSQKQLERLMILHEKCNTRRFDEMLNLRKYDIEYDTTSKRNYDDMFHIVHGLSTAKGAARINLMNYQVSGTAGHTHRLNMVHLNTADGIKVWAESGCMRKIEQVEYLPTAVVADWMQGFVVVNFDMDAHVYHCQVVPIMKVKDHYSCVYNGTLYTA